ncbi:unnamed protein product [Brassica oleracea]
MKPGSFMSEKSAKIFVAGHRGLVGSAIVRKLQESGFTNLILRTHSELDLTNQADVESFFSAEKPAYVILAAAKVGGIHANNTYPADFIAVNLQIQTNVIHSAYTNGVKKLLFLGSSCIYPKFAPQPIPESALLTGPLEPTNEWYAIAKIAGIKMCQAYRIQHQWDAISGMPTNLYGPNDNFHPENSHMNREKLMKMATTVRTGGKGTVRRKKKAVHKTNTIDDKKLQSTLKRIGVNSIPAIEEVNIFKDDVVIQFTNPKVQASIAANTWVVSGSPQTKKLEDILPQIISQLGPDNMDNLRKLAEQLKKQPPGEGNASATIQEEDDDDVPDLVAGETFEAAAAEEKVAAPAASS